MRITPDTEKTLLRLSESGLSNLFFSKIWPCPVLHSLGCEFQAIQNGTVRGADGSGLKGSIYKIKATPQAGFKVYLRTLF